MREAWIRQHFGPETTARPGFEDELADDLSAAWNGRPVGRVATRATAPATARSGRAVGWKAVVGIAACAALVVAVVKFSGSKHGSTTPGGETDSSSQVTGPGGGSAVPGQTDPATGQPGVTTVGGGTGGEVVSRTEYFSPACHDSTRSGAASLPSESSLDTFGPLSAQPTLLINLPSTASGGYGDGKFLQRIPGGVLVAVSALVDVDAETYSETLLAAVDADGTTRWVRCFADAYTPIFDPANDANTITIEGGGKTGRIYRHVSLADGGVSPLLQGYTPAGQPGRAYGEDDATGDDGTVYTYVRDGSTLGAFTATSSSGDVLWQVPSLTGTSSPGQTFLSRMLSDTVVLTIGCTKPGADGDWSSESCGMGMSAVNTTDGTILWQTLTSGGVAALDDRYAIVRDPVPQDGWRMIDLSTGEVVPGQVWSDGKSFNATMEQMFHESFTVLDGGVVIVTIGSQVRVWYPAAAGTSPHTVNLP